jgi:putative DNA primase/helicase
MTGTLGGDRTDAELRAAFGATGTVGNPLSELQAAVQRLAALTPLEYERVRMKEAEVMKARVTTLDVEVERARRTVTGDNGDSVQGQSVIFDAPELWPESVDGAAMLSEAAEAFNRYLLLPDGAADVMALWTLHAHCFDAFMHTPRLNITAPEKGCGKTLALDVLYALTPKPIRTENLSTAVLFRIVEKHTPTLLIDEYDSFLKDNDELRGAMNAGYKRGGCVMRCEGESNEIKTFRTFAPVALAGIRSLPGTLADRSIIIRMQRLAPNECRARFDSRHTEQETVLCRKLARWAADNFTSLENLDPRVPDGAYNRIADNWRPLFAIAETAGGGWPERSRCAFDLLAKPDDDAETLSVLLLADLRDLFNERGDSLLSADIVEALGKIEERPWPEYRNGKPITARHVAAMLRHFNIKPKQIWSSNGTNQKGYKREHFTDIFTRYLANIDETSARPLDAKRGAASSDFQTARQENALADENEPKPKRGACSSGLADQKSPAWEVRV